MQTNPAVERSKSLDGPWVRGISPVGKEKVYGNGKGNGIDARREYWWK